MNELGEGDIDIIKAPIVIDNVSILRRLIYRGCLGIGLNEGGNRRRVRAITRL